MLRLYFLGEQRVSDDGAADAPSPVVGRALEILAALVVNAGRPQERERLAGLLWPESTDQQARTNLRRELHGLRQLPGLSGCIRTDGTALVWRDGPGCTVDLLDFRRDHDLAVQSERTGDPAGLLRHGFPAITAYRGELLPGLYSDWVLAARESLHRQCVALCDRVAAAAAATDPAGAQAAARHRVELEPLEEAGYQTLMELQSAAGDTAAAVRTYHRCSATLEQELGVAPGPRTQALARQLLGFTPVPRPAGGRAVMNLRPGARATLPVARERELAELEQRWNRARAGTPGLVLVTGDGGVGKTRLLATLLATAKDSRAVTAYARCFDGAGSMALAPVAAWLDSEALRPFTGGNAFRGRDGEAAGAARSAGASPAGSPDTAPANPPEDRTAHHWAGAALADAWRRRAFHEGLARSVLAPSRPTLLILDDLQWCDEETMDWLEVLFELAVDAPLLVAAAARVDELDANTATLESLNALRNGRWVQDLQLQPLDTAHTAELAASILDRTLSVKEAALLHAATGGYPLHVVETARGMAGATLERVLGGAVDGAGVLRRRFEQCSPKARETASLAAAYGRGFSLETLALAWPGSEQSLVRAVDELWRRRILREQHGGYDFTHDLLRNCAYELVSPPRRWQLHRSLARALEAQHPGNKDAVAAQLAEQYRSAGDVDRAVAYFVQAGDAATRTFANARAVANYQAGLDLLRRQAPGAVPSGRELELLLHMPQPLTALRGYTSPKLHATLERIVELAGAEGRSRILVSALIGLFAAMFVQGRTRQAHALASQALQLAHAMPELVGQANFAVAGAATSLGRTDEALAHFKLAFSQAPDGQSYILGTRIEVHARGWASHTLWLAGDDDGALALAAEAVDRATLAEHPYSLAVALGFRAVLLQMRMGGGGRAEGTVSAGAPHETGDRDRLAGLAAELEQLCARRNFAYYGHWGTILRGWAVGGESGVATIRTGIGRLQATMALARMPYWQSLLAGGLLDCGRTEEAQAVLAGAESAAIQHDDLWWLPEILRSRGLLADPPAGRLLLARAESLAAGQGSRMLAERIRTSAGIPGTNARRTAAT